VGTEPTCGSGPMRLGGEGPGVRRSGATASDGAAGPAGEKTGEGREEGDEPDQWDRRVRERRRGE
jgi:hypothetical protein